MRQANFIVGFNNWGKTTVINNLFGGQRFFIGYSYSIQGINGVTFAVQSQSNDDVGTKLINQIEARLTGNSFDLFACLCPTLEEGDGGNDARAILTNNVFAKFDQLNLFLLKYKYENHAELLIDEIRHFLRNIPKINIIVIDDDREMSDPSDRLSSQLVQIKKELARLY